MKKGGNNKTTKTTNQQQQQQIRQNNHFGVLVDPFLTRCWPFFGLLLVAN